MTDEFMTAPNATISSGKLQNLVQSAQWIFHALDWTLTGIAWSIGVVTLARLPWSVHHVTSGSFFVLTLFAIVFALLARSCHAVSRTVRDFPYYSEEESCFLSCRALRPVLLGTGFCFIVFSSPCAFLAFALLFIVVDVVLARLATWLEDGPLRRIMTTIENAQIQDHFEEEWDTTMKDDSQLVHQQTRRTLDNGLELIEGLVRVPFEPRQEQQTVHLSFCPPLASTPTLDFGILSDDEVQTKVTLLMPYGARIELKRTLPTTSTATNLSDNNSGSNKFACNSSETLPPDTSRPRKIIIPLGYAAQTTTKSL